MLKWSIEEEDITSSIYIYIYIYIYTPNIDASRYTWQIPTSIKGEIDGYAIIVGDLNTPLTSMERFYRQKINKATEILNDTVKNLNLIDIFRTLHTKK